MTNLHRDWDSFGLAIHFPNCPESLTNVVQYFWFSQCSLARLCCVISTTNPLNQPSSSLIQPRDSNFLPYFYLIYAPGYLHLLLSSLYLGHNMARFPTHWASPSAIFAEWSFALLQSTPTLCWYLHHTNLPCCHISWVPLRQFTNNITPQNIHQQ